MSEERAVLSAEVIKTDHDLEAIAGRSTEQLARHRWHWTLDESNPDRVSILAYARAIGATEQPIRVMVKGYASFVTRHEPDSNLDDHIGKARMSGETAAAAEAVAKARGISMRTAQDSRGPVHNEVRRVRDIARDLAEKHSTSVEEEAPKVAETIVRNEQAEQAERTDRDARTDLRIIELEQHLRRAEKNLQAAKQLAAVIGWDDESRALVHTTWANVKALTKMIDALIVGADWDKELERLNG
jgi:hypothetical protein